MIVMCAAADRDPNPPDTTLNYAEVPASVPDPALMLQIGMVTTCALLTVCLLPNLAAPRGSSFFSGAHFCAYLSAAMTAFITFLLGTPLALYVAVVQHRWILGLMGLLLAFGAYPLYTLALYCLG